VRHADTMRAMHRTGPRRRELIALAVAAACVFAWCPSAFALNPALDVSQYAHTAWKIRDGLVKGVVNSIAQTPDGYLWLGTEFGLFRFDGVRTVAWVPPRDQRLPSNDISALLVGRDGTLWIGTRRGLASWAKGTLIDYPQLAEQAVSRLLQDHDGAVWAGGIGSPTGRLCVIDEGNVRCVGEDGGLGLGVVALCEDRRGTLWVGVQTGLWHWKPGAREFYSVPSSLDGIQGLAQADDGTLLISMRDGIGRLVNGKPELVYPLPPAPHGAWGTRLLRDRDGGLWLATQTGLVHVHQRRTDVFASSDGLSGDHLGPLFEDREGNVWVATRNGLDRFREFAVATYSTKQGLFDDSVEAVLTARDGSIWLGTALGLNRWAEGHVRPSRPRQAIQSLLQDERGRIWVSTLDGVGYLDNDRIIQIPGIPGGTVRMVDTPDGVWIAHIQGGLFHTVHDTVVQRFAWTSLQSGDWATALATDPRRGGLWLGFSNGGVVYFEDSQVRESYSARVIGEGRVNSFRLDADNALWISSAGGLSRLKNGRITTLNSKNGLPCDGVNWTIGDNAYSIWLKTPCGLVRVPASALEGWTVRVEHGEDPAAPIPVTVFDASDGVRITTAYGYAPLVAKSPDGKLWFTGPEGVGVIDPGHLPINTLPPPVRIEQITADRTVHEVVHAPGERMSLPALTRDLEVDYTALSLVVPEKNQYRVRLEGHDPDWRNMGNQRQAFYADLAPGPYRFHVIASNNSGVWNETGDVLEFSIMPAWYQRTLVRTAAVVALFALLWAMYRYRIHRIALVYDERVQARVGERTRIARDLHDTLLQSFQGVVLRFRAASLLLPDRPEDARHTLDSAIDHASQAIVDARSAVESLRASTDPSTTLVDAIPALAAELAADHVDRPHPEFRLHVEGTPGILKPLIRDDIYRVAREALRNAFTHAGATRIEADLRYDRSQFRLRIRDDGKGIEQRVIDEGGRTGHYGLAGMRERAELIGGTLTLWSERGSGTEIELTIPGSVAYDKSSFS